MPRWFFSILVVLVVLGAAGCVHKNRHDLAAAPVSSGRLELGLKVRSVSAAAHDLNLKGQTDKLLLVTQVKTDSLAGKMGVQTGDLLHRIDDQPVTGITDSYAILQHKTADQPLVLDVYRNKEKIRLSSE